MMMRTMTRTTAVATGFAIGCGLFVLSLAERVAVASDPNGAVAPSSPTASKSPKKPARGADAKAKPAASPKTKGARARARARAGKQNRTGTAIGGNAIAADVQLVPFPSHADAARHALAQNRRDQLTDAEKAARAPRQDERWQTVLFNLSALDARGDVEACFWRVLAYYRLGEVRRARSIRQLCSFSPIEEASLDKEEGLAGSLQPAAVMPEMLATGERAPEPVPNPTPYAGASPSHVER